MMPFERMFNKYPSTVSQGEQPKLVTCGPSLSEPPKLVHEIVQVVYSAQFVAHLHIKVN